MSSVYEIESPCEQSWDEMSERRDGRYCAHCDSVVIDASRVTQAELDALMAADEHLCVQFSFDDDGGIVFAPALPRQLELQRRALVDRLLAATTAPLLFLAACTSGEPVEPPVAVAAEVSDEVSDEAAIGRIERALPPTQVYPECSLEPRREAVDLKGALERNADTRGDAHREPISLKKALAELEKTNHERCERTKDLPGDADCGPLRTLTMKDAMRDLEPTRHRVRGRVKYNPKKKKGYHAPSK